MENELDPQIDANDAPTMEDTIAATLAEINARGETGDDAEVTASDEVTDSRVRDASGRYAPKDAAAPEAAPVDQQVEAAPVSVPPEVQRLGLRKEAAEAFAKADPVLREEFLRRSEEMHRGLEQYREKATLGQTFEQTMAPYMQTIQSTGLQPQECFRQLLESDKTFRYGDADTKAVHALQMVRAYGIDLNKVFQIATGQYAPASQPVQAPQQQAAPQQDISAIVEQAIEQRTLKQEIASFGSQPGHEHFEELKPLIASLLSNGSAQGLVDAYDQALRAHPVYGKEWLAKQLSDQENARKTTAANKAQEARRAAAVNVSKRGTMPAAKPVGTMDDTIRETAQRLGMF